ncbi:LytR C-terminal domain-containing protein [Nocardioides sp. MAHUQ-72]|uniref:LytR C-terminal domain-containing protein n=1 Tax=unclassified Nocardioides TaxID=2615069 RepID=UPI003621100A
MRAGARSAATIGVLGVLLLVGALWGWSAMTEPFPGKADPALCEDQPVAEGEKVFPEQVVVSVFNAGDRQGLAAQTMAMLQRRGFQVGESGNTSRGEDVARVQVWTDDRHNPAALLVARQLGSRVPVVEKRKTPGAGVAVIVGDGFDKLVRGPRKIVARSDAEICSPPVS